MYQEKEKQRKLKKREENLILESQLVKDQKKSKKEVFEHWELDSVVSSRGESKACFATFVELKTRFYVAIKMPDRSKNSMLEAIKQLTSNIPKEVYIR